tara:strand:- start:149 stop:349 length:201 start_codon:yes stop_codon:yes gene_type:complete
MMKYSRKEYEKMVKLKMPSDDAYVMGRIPQVKDKVNASIDKVKTIQYLCEESIVSLEELKEELNKL